MRSREDGVKRLLIMASALALGIPGAALAQEGAPDWMTGKWCTAPAPTRTCENWSPVTGGAAMGVSRTVKDGKTVNTEAMMIVTLGGKLTYVAKPSDAAEPTRFVLVSGGPGELVFENATHDYPQRIRYWREGEVLMAEISLADGSKPMRWRYERVTP